MRLASIPLVALLMLGSMPSQDDAVVTVIGLADYHSHAVPFRSEGRPNQGGIARVVAYLKAARAEGPTLVLSGGDTLNQGVPAWSDEYRCIEWPWLEGLVDVMALGNHDLDYGAAAFEQCRKSVTYPVIASNLVHEDGSAYFQAGGKPYVVAQVAGRRIGLFAVAGDDFARLVKSDNLPPDTRLTPALEAARRSVEALRTVEKVDAVICIGHQPREDDEAMARAVPGIDLVLGTHSHHKGALTTIPGTATRYVAPYQYLAYLSRARLLFHGHALAGIDGGLVAMDESRPEDPEVSRRVAKLQKALEVKRPDRFAVIGELSAELSDAGLQDGPAPIGTWATEACRQAAGVHAYFSTASSFRGALPPGRVTVEDLYAALPYPNRVVTAEMTGQQLLAWLDLSLSRRGSDGFSQASGLRYALKDGHATEVRILRDPARLESTDAPLDAAAVYRIGTTDFQAYVAAGYKELFAAARNPRKTDLDVHAILRAALAGARKAP